MGVCLPIFTLLLCEDSVGKRRELIEESSILEQRGNLVQLQGLSSGWDFPQCRDHQAGIWFCLYPVSF